MRLLNANPTNLLPFLKKFAPNQSGKMGYALTPEGDIEIFAIERCDCCDAEVRGANPITIVKPQFGILSMVRDQHIFKSNVVDEGGCDDDGNLVCPACYEEGEVNRAMLRVEGGV